jgi:hypothetical protein
MDCSDGAKMLIDQMKEHPEEFRGYAGKFTDTLALVEAVHRGESRRISMRDATAILAAAETHLYEVWLAEDVLTMIMKPKEEAEEPKYKVGRTQLGVWQGAVPPGSVITANTSTSQYDAVYLMEKEKYRMELEKLRQQANEFAMRLTKPFKNYL